MRARTNVSGICSLQGESGVLCIGKAADFQFRHAEVRILPPQPGVLKNDERIEPPRSRTDFLSLRPADRIPLRPAPR